MIDAGWALAGTAALLAAPGPTNLVLATAGAQRGLRRGLPLLLPALMAYVGGIWGLNLLLARVPSGLSVAVLQGCAALWLVVLAERLWTAPTLLAGRRAGTAFVVATTTLLNPKVAIFATLVFAPGTFPAKAPAFAVLFAVIGGGWVLAGAGLLRRLSAGRTLPRALAVAQMAFAAVAGWAALGAL